MSRCIGANYKIVKCVKCDIEWKGETCQDRDCSKKNGACGKDKKCIESFVNNKKYTECVCPTGTVRNNYDDCQASSSITNFVVRLNETFDTSADYDIRKKVKHCGRWGATVYGPWKPMEVVCVNFTLISRFVIIQQSDENFHLGDVASMEVEVYSADCYINNGNCGEMRCTEVLYDNVSVIKCEDFKKEIFIPAPEQLKILLVNAAAEI
ncbi:hypothetical protein HELRODRAFT_180444 [Helobdella robusta]|uniref:Uncharacterized protein n=1 Tax=Helobdella robusta TaxID=6412 RepID=T1FFX2_HELRO|nr:hypothetical protein HELRODRAFT_180444 [Helobdella robusta]ESN94017.1 hypothetical protein HELRODRAFT_180444 [Helobdella robusta]